MLKTSAVWIRLMTVRMNQTVGRLWWITCRRPTGYQLTNWNG